MKNKMPPFRSFLTLLLITFFMSLDKIFRKKIVVMDLEEPSFIPFIYPIFLSLSKKTQKVSFYIATSYPEDKKLEVFSIPKIKQFKKNLSKNLILTDLFLSANIYAQGYKNAIKVYVSHNQPVKFKALPKQNFNNFDTHFLIGPLHRMQTEETLKLYKIPQNSINLYNIGYPKSDTLLNGIYKREDIFKTLKLNPSLKTIIYAPSWEEGLSLRTYGVKIIKEILNVPNINLIVKLHPMSYAKTSHPDYKMFTGGIDWQEKLSFFTCYNNFRNIITDNVDPYLALSDILITDISGVALEFLILNKPVIYIDCPYYFETAFKNLYGLNSKKDVSYVKNDPKANAGRNVGLIVKKIDDLSITIRRCLKNPNQNLKKRKQFAKLLRYNPGNASEAASEKILELIGLNSAL